MTTIHTLQGRQAQVKADRRKPSKSNPIAVRDVFKEAARLLLDIPACVSDYNHNKVGVDVADQYQCYYSTQLITRRNWFPILFWILDTALINAFIIYRDLRVYKGFQHKDFRMHVAWELIMSGQRRTISKPQPKQQPQERTANEIVNKTTTHIAICVPAQDRRVCHLCKKIEKEQGGVRESRLLPKTQWKCEACNLPLCLNTSRNCFYIHHQSF